MYVPSTTSYALDLGLRSGAMRLSRRNLRCTTKALEQIRGAIQPNERCPRKSVRPQHLCFPREVDAPNVGTGQRSAVHRGAREMHVPIRAL